MDIYGVVWWCYISPGAMQQFVRYRFLPPDSPLTKKKQQQQQQPLEQNTRTN
jgi:hypothetical protein